MAHAKLLVRTQRFGLLGVDPGVLVKTLNAPNSVACAMDGAVNGAHCFLPQLILPVPILDLRESSLVWDRDRVPVRVRVKAKSCGLWFR